MPPAYTNIHGRKPGRGLRPWLLLPKVLFVAIYLGSIVTAAVLFFTDGLPPQRAVLPSAAVLNQVAAIFKYVSIPAVALALLFGVLLFLQHPRVFIRMRWVRVKLVLLLIGVPGMHVFMNLQVKAIRAAMESGDTHTAADTRLAIGFVVLIAGSLLIAFLGRQKPRLGQNWARSFASLRREEEPA